MPFHTSTATAKAALEGLVISLAAELAPAVRVNAIAPSLTVTPLADSLLKNQATRDKLAMKHPLQRLGEADDIARMAIELLNNTWMTGQIIGVNGGLGTIRID